MRSCRYIYNDGIRNSPPVAAPRSALVRLSAVNTMTRTHGQRESNNGTIERMFTVINVVVLLHTSIVCALFEINEHDQNKIKIFEEESAMGIGGEIVLTPAETLANFKLMSLKYAELDTGFDNPYHFNFSKHYFQYQHNINASKVYQIIKHMPKGAALHIHSSMMLGPDYILKLTYEDNLYVCFENDTIKLLFSDNVPQRPCAVKWELMSDVRNATKDVLYFDENLKKHFTLFTEDDAIRSADINTIWQRFDKVYYILRPLLGYRPVREKYFYDALKKFYEDNIMYIEIRSGLHSLYELNGTKHDSMYMARLYDKISNKFSLDHPDFIGVKLIYTRHRRINLEQLCETIQIARKVKVEMPNLFAGLDLVGQEDLGKPLSDFLPVLAKTKNEFNYYFHAGETNWFGTTSDENLMDAILLGTKRIGHAYALVKHPNLMEAVRKQDIALEINVLSNVVLSLVRDVRNHPLATFLALGLPVVLSSDDPGAWDAEPLSHDFYVAFVGVASRRADIRTLKQLALNSLNYSALDVNEKNRALELFHNKWNKFIRDVNLMNMHS